MHALWRLATARHFAHPLPGFVLRGLLDHLAGCAACRGHFERHLQWEALLPDAEARVGRRLARQALALHGRAAAPARLWLGGLGVAAAAAALTLWVTLRPAPPALQARGGDDGKPAAIAVLVRYPGMPGFTALVDAYVAGGEIGFRVRRPERARWLALFVVDSTGQVHNLYPASSDGAPLSLAGLVDGSALPDAFAPALPAGRAQVVAVLGEHADSVDVAELERALGLTDRAASDAALARHGRVQRVTFAVLVADGGAP